MNTIDLFSGCGGLSLGFSLAGFNIVAAFDNWKPAISVYKRNFKHPIFNMDLCQTDNIKPIMDFNPDMIIGGPPCQDFSIAGKRDESLGRADLTMSFSEIIYSLRPSLFVMENVDRITKSPILEVIKNNFRQNGYGLTEQVLNAKFCGVPQNRKRYFLVGHLGASDNFLKPYYSNFISNKAMSVYDYIGMSWGIEYYYRHPRSYARRGIFSIHEPSPTIRGVNRPIPKGYKKHPKDPVDPKNGIYPLTTIQRSYIQTFPNNFIFDGNKTDLEQMIGNAVPVKLAEFVGKCIVEYLLDTNRDGNRTKGVFYRQAKPTYYATFTKTPPMQA